MNANETEDDKNPYLALREAKIKRNEARLRELGLLKKAPDILKAAEESRAIAAKRKAPAEQVVPVRRSTRSRTSVVSYVAAPDPPEPRRRRSSISSKVAASKELPDNPSAKVSPSPSRISFSNNSARSMHLDVERLVCGDGGEDSGLLGRTMEQTGKAFVMEESARRAAGYERGAISFNKYSGVQEWGNDALFLWINLGAPNCDVINDFLDHGRLVTWFGGSRMHDETSVIQRLVRVGQKATTSSGSSGIVLWCRQYDTEKRGFAPYICLGRLSYHSHQPGSRPLAFVWNLLDYEHLVNNQDERVQKNIDRMIRW